MRRAIGRLLRGSISGAVPFCHGRVLQAIDLGSLASFGTNHGKPGTGTATEIRRHLLGYEAGFDAV